MQKRFLVMIVDESMTADDLRSVILDGLGFPIRFDDNPDLLKVTELDDKSAEQTG